MTHDPHAGDALLLHHALHGATGLGVFVHDHALYLHLANEGERFVIDVTRGGILIGGRDYEALMHNAASHYERAAVSLAGLAGTESTPVKVASDEPAVLPFVRETVAESPELSAGGEDAPMPEFDMGPTRRFGFDDDAPFLASVTGLARAHEAEKVEGWSDDEA